MALLDYEERVVQTHGPTGRYWGTQTLGLHPLLSFSAALEVAESDGVWTLADRETGIFGAGPDQDSAARDFAAALREHRDVLERQATLSEELQAQLRYLRRIVG